MSGEEGSTFSFGFTLVGRATDFLPYFVYAFQRMGELGIGKRRGTFELIRVDNLGLSDQPPSPPFPLNSFFTPPFSFEPSSTPPLTKGGRGDFLPNSKQTVSDSTPENSPETIYEDGVLRMPQTFLMLPEALRVTANLDPQVVRLRFLTPLRLVKDGDLCRNPEFYIVARNLLRRLTNLVSFHCGQEPDVPLGALLDTAETVRIAACDTRWYDWQRYSKRQDKKMNMGGLVGEVVYEGDLVDFLPLLVLGSWVNLGKGTSFGLGRYLLETREQRR